MVASDRGAEPGGTVERVSPLGLDELNEPSTFDDDPLSRVLAATGVEPRSSANSLRYLQSGSSSWGLGTANTHPLARGYAH